MTTRAHNKSGGTWRVVAHVISALCFIGLAPLVYLAGARILPLTDAPHLVLLESFTPYLFLPAYPVLAFALLAHRKVLSVVSVVLVVCHLVWTVPQFQPADELPQGALEAPSVKVFSQNVRYDNPTPALIANSIADNDAAFLLLQELSHRDLSAIRSTGVLERYPYEMVHPTNGPDGIGMWSKYPLSEAEVVQLSGFPALRATTLVRGYRIVLWNIHTRPPPLEGGSLAAWRNDLTEIRQRLHAESGNVIAAGDFNATWSHKPYRDIIDEGYSDVHVTTGRGYARSWPVDRESGDKLGGFILIDHMLIHGDLRATRIAEEPGYGSDHRGLIAYISLV